MGAYRVAVAGQLPGAVMRILSDAGASAVDDLDPPSAIEVIDQAALISVLERIHALGVTIERIERVR